MIPFFYSLINSPHSHNELIITIHLYSEREYLNCILTKRIICIIFDYMDERVKFAE